MAETKSKSQEDTNPAAEPELPKIAGFDEPWGIFTDLMLRPNRFFAQATQEHLVEGAKVGVVSAVLGFMLGIISTLGVNWALSDPQGAPVDGGAAWAAPITLAIVLVALLAEFLVSVGMVRLLRGKGHLKEEALAFDCSLAPVFLWAIPFLGIFVAPIYQAVVFGRGLAHVDEVSAGRAYASVIVGVIATASLFFVALIVLAVAAGM